MDQFSRLHLTAAALDFSVPSNPADADPRANEQPSAQAPRSAKEAETTVENAGRQHVNAVTMLVGSSTLGQISKDSASATESALKQVDTTTKPCMPFILS